VAKIIAPILAALGLVLFLAAPNAQAMTSYRLYTVYGSYLVGAPTIASGAGVLMTLDGRDLYFEYTGNGNNVKMVFAANQSYCVASPDGSVTVEGCSAVGTVWNQVQTSGGNFLFSNNYMSKNVGATVYLTGDNNEGDIMWVATRNAQPGDLQTFNFTNS
jgi:hypothetical protein